MKSNDVRLTARMRRTRDGDVVQEYIVDGVAYGSLEDLELALEGT